MKDFTSTLFVVLLMLFCVYLLLVYLLLIDSKKQTKKLRRFHNAILSVYQKFLDLPNDGCCPTLDGPLKQLTLDYNKMCQELGNRNEISLLDMLEKYIYYYDTYSEKQFKSAFKIEKDSEIRNFIFAISEFILEKDPFVSLSSKEATLLNNINNALKSNNTDLGSATLKQLSEELQNKEKQLKKQEKDNQLATMISIIGIVLTVAFGIMSLI